MANAAPQLQEAFDLIESGDLQSARQLLESIRSQNENNPDYWWIYAHAVEDEQDGILALERVQQLAPNHPGLNRLSEELGIQSLQRVNRIEDAPSTEDVEEFYDSDEFAGTVEIRQNATPVVTIAIAILGLVIIIGVLFVMLNAFTDNDTTTAEPPTQVAVNVSPVLPTSDATEDDEAATSSAESTSESTAESTSSDPFTSLYDDLEAFGVPEDGISTGTTETFGDTYIVTTCSPAGPVAIRNITSIVAKLADNQEAYDDTIDGYAFAITDCDTDTPRITLGLTADDVQAFWDDPTADTAETDLQRALTVVN